MKLHLTLYGFEMFRDLRNIIRNYKISKKRTNILVFNSETLQKIELSIELIYEIIYSSTFSTSVIFGKKKGLLLLLETIIGLLKLNELKKLTELGFNFYIDKPIYYEHVLNTTDEELFSKVESLK